MNNLTPDEQKFIELFRCLTPEAQQIVLRLIRLMKKAQDET
nr:MAG TPA: Fanconi-associated nuclease-like protein [Caudoviricetes sp.]